MPHQSAADQRMEEEYNAALVDIKKRIVEREAAEGGAAKAQADKNVASAIGRCASNWPHRPTRGKLMEAQSMYKSADSSGKDQIIKKLSEVLLVKSTIAAAIAGLTALSLVGISGLTAAYQVTDQYGNMHDAHTVYHDDGTYDVYTDMNDNGIPDVVQGFHAQSGGPGLDPVYVPDGPSHDPGCCEASGDFCDVICSIFSCCC